MRFMICRQKGFSDLFDGRPSTVPLLPTYPTMQRRDFLLDSTKYALALGLFPLIGCQQDGNNYPDGTATDGPVELPESKIADLEEMTIAQLQAGFEAGTFSTQDIIQAYLDRIEAIDRSGPTLHSILEVNPDAMEIAKQLDEERASGNVRGPMHGVPVVLKDNLDTQDKMMTTAGSRALLGSHALQDSTVAAKLREAGAVILAKANLSEWANFRSRDSSSGWSGRGGQTHNPYRIDRNPCGSSSGSGVSVSANLCMVAIGTETNGSIVCPSSANGVVGIKPTVGLVSRAGIIPISVTQDTAGPMARTVRDAAICLSVLTGVDSRDSKTAASEAHIQADYTQFLNPAGLSGKRLGLYQPAMGFHREVDILMEQAMEACKAAGATVVEIDRISKHNIGREGFQVLLYEFKDGLNAYFATLAPDAPIKSLAELIEFNKQDSIELKYFDQSLLELAQEKGDLETKEYRKALEKMLRETRDKGIDRVMAKENLDAFIAPTGSAAWKTDLVNGDHFLGASSSPAARAGYPNITVPMGFIDELPVGMSIFGKAWSEPTLIEIAYSFEQATQHRKAPKFLPPTKS